MTEPNREWEMLGSAIAQLASVGAKPWELRWLALKGKHVSFRDLSKAALRHDCDMSAPKLVGRKP